jgi:hypothetical protein
MIPLRRTAAFIAYELRTQGRSLRFRVTAAVYVIAGSLPAALTYARRSSDLFLIGGATYAGETMHLLPLLTGALAILLSLDGIGRERSGGAWTTVALTDLTNAGYLFRRWIALLAVVVPLTAVPLLAAAGFAIAGGTPPAAPDAFWGPWLLHILPLAILGTTLGLGLGTIGGSGMGLFLTAAVFLVGFPWLVNRSLSHLGYSFGAPLAWLDLRTAGFSVSRIASAFNARDPDRWVFPAPATEAGFDLSTAAEQSLADGCLLAMVSAAALGLGIVRLRRTRPDLRPWTVREDHPLRSFLRVFGRLREAFTLDPALAPADRTGLTMALVLAALAGAVVLARADRYDESAWRMVRAEMNPPPPMSRDILPGLWTIEGTVTADGEVALRVAGTLRNAGRAPEAHLAFALARGLQVAGIAADAGRVRPVRIWDRLLVDLDPPLRPGESRELRFRLSGRPARTVFPDRPKPHRLVDQAFGAHQRSIFARDLIDFSPSYQVPAVSGYRVALRADDLLPVPRYGPWTFTNDYGVDPRVADEVVFPKAEVRLSLAVPPDLFLADACGGVAHGGRLESRCALPLAELMVAGGRHRVLTGGETAGTTVAVFPAHQGAGEIHLGFLARSARMLGEAWPGLGGLGQTVLLEWPDEAVHNRNPGFWFFDYYWEFDPRFVDVQGRLILLQEREIIGSRPIEPEALVAEVVASRLAQRRRLDPDQQLFFRRFFRALALQRLGLGPERGAVVGPLDQKDLPLIQEAALRTNVPAYWHHRFPALIAALEHRTGREPLRAAVDELLSREGDRPASFDEFEEILRRHATEPVDGLIRDFFRAPRMPELVLEDVAFRRTGDRWQATGRVHNLADGEAICRVVLAAAVTPVETTVTVETGGSVPFSLETPHRPQAVFLDPDNECHRMVRMGAPRDRVFFEGGRP